MLVGSVLQSIRTAPKKYRCAGENFWMMGIWKDCILY